MTHQDTFRALTAINTTAPVVRISSINWVPDVMSLSWTLDDGSTLRVDFLCPGEMFKASFKIHEVAILDGSRTRCHSGLVTDGPDWILARLVAPIVAAVRARVQGWSCILVDAFCDDDAWDHQSPSDGVEAVGGAA